jgi:uncharacterized spore protein YtfJ
MDVEIQTLLDSLADLREKANVNSCFGDPVTVEGRTVIPVAKVGYGFAMMAGHETGAEKKITEKTTGRSSRSGGAVRAHPLAVVEMTPERVWVEPVVDEQKLALAGALLTGWSVFWLARALVNIFGQQER